MISRLDIFHLLKSIYRKSPYVNVDFNGHVIEFVTHGRVGTFGNFESINLVRKNSHKTDGSILLGPQPNEGCYISTSLLQPLSEDEKEIVQKFIELWLPNLDRTKAQKVLRINWALKTYR